MSFSWLGASWGIAHDDVTDYPPRVIIVQIVLRHELENHTQLPALLTSEIHQDRTPRPIPILKPRKRVHLLW